MADELQWMSKVKDSKRTVISKLNQWAWLYPNQQKSAMKESHASESILYEHTSRSVELKSRLLYRSTSGTQIR